MDTAITGLTSEEVAARVADGRANVMPQSVTPTVLQICKRNIFTLFNFIHVVLVALFLFVGEIEQTIFIFVAISNTLMGIVQELRSKRTLDKLSILAASKVTVLRDGAQATVLQHEVVLDDIMILTAGCQICADAEVVTSDGLEVNESLLTGEQDNIGKKAGDKVMSGSFVVAGQASARVTTVGAESFAASLTVEAKQMKRKTPPLMRTLNGIIRVLTFVIIPVGALLFWNQYNAMAGAKEDIFAEAVIKAAGGMLGMIPEGLILLTSLTLTVGAMKLAGRKALVQSLPSIETLARVDVLCLDKTGTITDGTLSFKNFVLREGFSHDQAARVLAELMGALSDDNATAAAMRAQFGSKTLWKPVTKVPFSSARKWSGVTFRGEGTYILGAPAFVFPSKREPFFKTVDKYASAGYRVLCLAHSPETLDEGKLPPQLQCMGLVIFADNIRPEAPDTFRFFADEGVTLKVISGDDPATVSTIAHKAGIENAEKYVDMSEQGEKCDYYALVLQYTVFGRVSPHQKRELIRALKRHKLTTCMTGDGVNDVLAMKAADCSVAMVGGSDAARSASDFVLMTSDFSAMVNVLKEGRRVINNIEGVACLYLVKTIYSTVMSLIFSFVPYPYPFEPNQMTPINMLTVGIPSFVLALRENFQRPRGRFVANIFENALPAAITVIANVFLVLLAGIWFELSTPETSTMNVLLTGAVGFAMLWKVSKPHTGTIKLLVGGCIVLFFLMFIVAGPFLKLESLFTRNVFFYLPLLHLSVRMFYALSSAVVWLENRRPQPKHSSRKRPTH